MAEDASDRRALSGSISDDSRRQRRHCVCRPRQHPFRTSQGCGILDSRLVHGPDDLTPKEGIGLFGRAVERPTLPGQTIVSSERQAIRRERTLLDSKLDPRLCAIAIAGTTLLALLPLTSYMLDDAYITYRYARNIASGNGFAFNVGEPVLGTTTPGYTLLLALFNLLFQTDFPKLSFLLTIAFTCITGWLLYQILRCWVRDIPALAGAMLYVTNPVLTSSLGMETSLYIVLIAASVYLLYVRPCSLACGVAIGLTILVRPDGLIVLGIPVLAWITRKIRFRSVLIVGVAAFLMLVPWLVYSYLYFGSPIPHSLCAKQQHVGQPAESELFIRGFSFLAKRYLRHSLVHALFIPLTALGLLSIKRRRSAVALAILAWAAVYTAAFEFLDVPNHFIWYWAPLTLAFVVLVASGAASVLDWQRSEAGRLLFPSALLMTLISCMLAGLVVGQVASGYKALDWSPRFYTYRSVGEYLRTVSDRSDTIGCWEIGIIGYYSDRPILDLVGITSPAVMENGPRETVRVVSPKYLVDAGYPGYKVRRVFLVTPYHEGENVDVPEIKVFVRANP